jgi:regulator of sigma E protease
MNIQTILEFVLAIASLILVHEIGHFLACLFLKIPVEEFGIGLPPRAITLFEVKGIKFSLNWLPFGGFVRAKGEQDVDVPDGLMAAPAWKRILVFLAGPTMNLLTAVVLFIAIYASLNFLPDRSRVILLEVVEGSPAASAGFEVLDRIIKVDDENIGSTDELRRIIYRNLGTPLQVTYERAGEIAMTTVTPLLNPGNSGAVGIRMDYDQKPFNLLAAVPEGFIATYDFSTGLLGMITQLISGQIPAEEGRLVGFKGMYDMYSVVRQSDTESDIPAIANVFSFVASITISLGLFNLLPIPALDGGRIAFALPELILRRRVPQKFEIVVNAVSLIVLLILMVVINLQDFIDPIVLTTPTP